MISLSVAIAVSDASLWQEIQSSLQEMPVRVAFEQAGVSDLSAFMEKVERFRPDAVMLDIGGLPCELGMLIEALSASSSAPFVIVLNSESRPDLILGALRAGAREFLSPPFSPTLQTALLRLSAERERCAPVQRNTGRLVGFLSAKGGCGATTIACHAATHLESVTGKSTLLCDFDLSSGLVRFLLQAHSRYSVLDAFANVHRLDSSYWRALISNGRGHLEVLSAPDAAPLKDLPNGQQVRQVLRFIRSEYDWSLIDFGHGLTPLTYTALEELDDLFLVTTAEVPALHRAKHVLQQLTAHGFVRNQVHLVLNRVRRRMEVSLEELEKLLGQPFYATLADYERELQDAYTEARLLSEDSPLAREVGVLVAKLAGLPEKTKKRFSLFG